MNELPLSARWLLELTAFLERTLLGELASWAVESRSDPLHLVLHLRLRADWSREDVNRLRQILKDWTEANDCVYRRSEYKRKDFRALIVLKGLGPLHKTNPYLEHE